MQQATFTFNEPIPINVGARHGLIEVHTPRKTRSKDGHRDDHALVLAQVPPGAGWYAFAITFSEGERRSTCSRVARKIYGDFEVGYMRRENLSASGLADKKATAYIICARRINE